ncbi:MAG: hypothetical protein K6T88_05610 [Bacillus sp. (in: Bacteria)]|nr:hypothetical protein [Bacillus sp. (in: firmicutes)]
MCVTMKMNYPIMLRLVGKKVIVVGGGNVADRGGKDYVLTWGVLIDNQCPHTRDFSRELGHI